MNEFNKMLRGNNMTVAVIFGFATFNFFQSVGGMLFGDLFNTGGTWVWKQFWVELCVYAVLTVVAWWVSMTAKS